MSTPTITPYEEWRVPYTELRTQPSVRFVRVNPAAAVVVVVVVAVVGGGGRCFVRVHVSSSDAQNETAVRYSKKSGAYRIPSCAHSSA